MALTEDLLVRLSVDAQGVVTGAKLATDAFSGFTKGASEAETAVDKFVAAAKEVALPLLAINQSLSLLGNSLAFIKDAFGSTIGEFAKFETALVGVQKTTNITGDELQNFGKEFQALSETIPVSSNELLGLAQSAGQLGVRGVENLTKFAETVAKVGVSTDLSGSEAAVAFARILTVTGEGVKNVDKFASAIVALGNNFAATEAEIVRVANETARSTSIFHLSSGEVLALAATMRSLGIRAQLGGSAVGQAFREIDQVIRQGTGPLIPLLTKLTGIAGTDLKKAFQDNALSVFQKFIIGLNKVQNAGGDVINVLEAFHLKGDEIDKVIPVLAQRSDELARALALTSKETQNATALNKESGFAFATLANQAIIMGNVLKNIAVEIGSLFGPAILAVVHGITEAAKVIEKFILIAETFDFKGLVEGFTSTAAAIAALFLTIKVVQLVEFASALKLTFIDLLALATQRVWLFIAAQIKSVVVLYQQIAAFVTANAAIIGYAAAIGAAVLALDIIFRNFTALSDLVGTVLVASFEALKSVVIATGIAFLTLAKASLDAVAGTFLDVGGAAEASSKKVGAALDNMKNLFKQNGKDIQEAGKGIVDSAKKLKEGFDFGIVGKGIGFVKDAAGKLSDGFSGAGDAAKKVGDSVSDAGNTMHDKLNLARIDIQALEAAEKELARAFEDLKKKTKEYNEKAAETGLSEAENARKVAQFRLDDIKALETKLLIAGKLVGKEAEILAAVAAVKNLESAEIAKLQLKTLKDIEKQNRDIANENKLFDLDELDKIKQKIDIEREKLQIFEDQITKDKLHNAAIDAEIAKQRQLLDIKEKQQIGTTIGDVTGVIKQAFDPNTYVEAFQRAGETLNTVIQDPVQTLIDAGKKTGKAVADYVKGIRLSKVGDALISAAKGAFEILKNVFSVDTINMLGDVLKGVGDFPAAMLAAFTRLGTIVDSIVSNLPQMVQDFVEKIPQVFKKLADSIPALTDALVDGIPKIVQALVTGLITAIPALAKGLEQIFPVVIMQVAKAIGPLVSALLQELPGIVNAIMDGVTAAIPELVKSIIQIIFKVAEVLPTLVEGFMERLPDLIQALAEAIPEIAFALVDAIIGLFLHGGIERIVGAILRAIPRIVVALVTGFVTGVINGLKGLFSGVNIGGGLVDGVKAAGKEAGEIAKKLGDGITKFSSQLFKVVDLTTEARKIDAGEQLAASIEGATAYAAEKLGGTFKFLKDIWDKVVNWFTSLFGPIISSAWNVIMKYFEGFKTIIEAAWATVMTVFRTLGSIVSDAWKTVITVLQSLGSIVSDAWKTIINFFQLLFQGKIAEAFQGVIDFFGRTFSTIWNGVFIPIVDFFTNAFTKIWSGVLKPIVDFFGTVFSVIWTNAFKPVIDFYATVFQKTWEKVLKPLLDLFGDGFKAIWDKALKPLFDFFANLLKPITDGFKGVFDFFKDLGKNIGFDGITKGFQKALDAVNPKNLFESLFHLGDNAWGTSTIENAISKVVPGFDIPFIKFAKGGPVPGTASIPGNSLLNDKIPAMLSAGEVVLSREDVSLFEKLFSPVHAFGGFKKPEFIQAIQDSVASAVGPEIAGAAAKLDPTMIVSNVIDQFKGDVLGKLSGMMMGMASTIPHFATGGLVGDTQPAMLTPGEFVMNRPSVGNIGIPTLQRANQGGGLGNQTINIELNIDNKGGDLDESYVRNRLMPAMLDAVRRASLDGKFVMSTKGIR